MPSIRSSFLFASLLVCAHTQQACKAKTDPVEIDAQAATGGEPEIRAGLSLLGLRSETVPLRCSCIDLVELEARPEYPRASRRASQLECAYTPSGSAPTMGELSVRVARISDEAAFGEAVSAALSSRVKALASNRFAVEGGEAYVAVVAGSGGVDRVSVVHLPEAGLVVTSEEPAPASTVPEGEEPNAGFPSYAQSVARNAAKACR